MKPCFHFVHNEFSGAPKTYSAFNLLPTRYLSREPLQELVHGFRMDLMFQETNNDSQSCFPIQTEADLDLYGSRVAGTVARLCLELVFAHYSHGEDSATRDRLIRAGAQMGIALQYVNISRDIAVDAAMRRVYIPTTWLEEEDLTPEAVIKNPKGVRIDKLRARLLDKAFSHYNGARRAIDDLPEPVRGPMRVAVESYMEIGRVLRERRYPVKRGRATVPKTRRIIVAWKALSLRG
jgi:15-cis-phytoene synthase / lycopene beta-cyclase